MDNPISETIKQTAGLVHEGGEFIDNIHTSKEEELQALAQLRREAGNLAKYDMASDSWMSKNIRPMALAWAMINTSSITIGIFLDVSFPDSFMYIIGGIDMLIFGFYFGGRTREKGFIFEAKKSGFFDRFRRDK